MIKGFLCILSLILITYNQSYSQTNSVLSTGKWVKLGITQSGIYKLDYNYLKNIGFDVNSLDPKKIAIYGNAQGILPQKNSDFRHFDLYENPIFVSGEEDGIFNASDYVIFYGEGPNQVKYDAGINMLYHVKNIYSDTSYYFITIVENEAKRIQQKQLSTSIDASEFDYYDEVYFHENDAVNIIKSGRDWYGEVFDATTSYTFEIPIKNRLSSSVVQFRAGAALKNGLSSSQSTNMYFKFFANGQFLHQIPVLASGSCTLCQAGNYNSARFFYNTSTEINKINLQVDFDRSGYSSSLGYLDFIYINYKRKLELNEPFIIFRNITSMLSLSAKYKINSNYSDTQIWDVSKPYHPQFIKSFGQNTDFQIDSANRLNTFVAFSPSQGLLQPASSWAIGNQNIKALEVPNFIIVTHQNLLSEAKRLAAHRESQGIKTQIFTTSEVYNEFSSGSQDITAIRDMARFFYKKDTTKLKNLLLFGSASYDYKNRLKGNNNLVPTYEARNSLHEINSYSSEDYYAFFGEEEGTWEEFTWGTLLGNHIMYIGVGRLPVSNQEEASIVVDKLINYDDKNIKGSWQTKYIFSADNGSNPGEGNIFLEHSEGLMGTINTMSKSPNFEKVYIDAYPMLAKSTGLEAPIVNENLRTNLNEGALILNYVGHGGTSGLAQESIVNASTIESYRNYNTLPFWIAASCDFTTYDNPAIVSNGYALIKARKGGGIGLLAATRAVYSHTNYALNSSFYSSLFSRDNSGKWKTMGEVFKETKNNSRSGVNNRSYVLLGDPSMTLAIPHNKMEIISINGLDSDTAKAQKTIVLKGKVVDPISNLKVANFNGVASIDVFDKVDTVNTLGQQFSYVTKFLTRNNLVYTGEASVVNGEFELSFIVPKDINYQVGYGKISLYAKSSNGDDAEGYSEKLYIGGGSENMIEDTIPPVIKLYLEDTTFKNGGLVSANPLLIARLSDLYGINIAKSALGHEIVAVIDGDENNGIVLNDYYKNDLNSYQSGTVRYIMPELSEGSHTLVLKAWDSNNNSNSAKIDFKVGKKQNIVIEELYNYPNPAGNNTTFSFTHNKTGEEIDVELMIYKAQGSEIRKVAQKFETSPYRVDIEINDLISENKILPGVYFYRCNVRSVLDNTHAEKVQKLVIVY